MRMWAQGFNEQQTNPFLSIRTNQKVYRWEVFLVLVLNKAMFPDEIPKITCGKSDFLNGT